MEIGIDIFIRLASGLFIVLSIVALSLMMLRKRHMGERIFATRIGATIYGALFALFIIVVLMPIRLAVMNGTADITDPVIMEKYFIAIVILAVLFRTDILGRLPLVGTYIRAYRMAYMRRAVENAEKRLKKMEDQEKERS